MNLLKRIATRLGLRKEVPKIDLTKPDPKWIELHGLRFARPAIQKKLWFRAIIRTTLRRSFGLSKLEKKLIRRNTFEGHWQLSRRAA